MDKDVIGAMKAAVEAAPEIWEMMDEMLETEEEEAAGDEGGNAGARAREEFREVLGRAKDVTERLRGSIAAVQQEGAHPQAVDGRALHDDAHLFVKVSGARVSFTNCWCSWSRRRGLVSSAWWTRGGGPCRSGTTLLV